MARDVSAEHDRALMEVLALYREDELFSKLAQDQGAVEATRLMLDSATALFRWLIGPVHFEFTIGPVRRQSDGSPTGRTIGGFPMQLHDDEQITLSVAVTDAKGAPIADDPLNSADNLVWSFDTESVATLQVSDDTRSATVVAGLPGSGTGTVTLGDLSATFAVDVVPGNAALISISEGTPEKQPPAAPTA